MRISNHALERYWERIKKEGINEIKRRIKADLERPGFQKAIEHFRDARFRYKIYGVDGVTYCLQAHTVTTCYPSK